LPTGSARPCSYHPNGGPLRRLAEDLELPFADTGSTLPLTVQQALPEGVEPPDTELEERPLAQADPALTEALRQGFAWQYPAAELAQVPAKVSVTGIVHKAEQTTLERPGFSGKGRPDRRRDGQASMPSWSTPILRPLRRQSRRARWKRRSLPSVTGRWKQSSPRPKLRRSWMQSESAALWRAKPLRASVRR